MSDANGKIGTTGSLPVHGMPGLRASYTDIPMSGELLKDDPSCPDWVEDGKRYWVRHSIGGLQILGPVLDVIEGELPLK
jgi:hypothetical protein